MKCCCGSDLPFEKCCAPCLSGEKPAKDPQALMRSRYAAFVRMDADYLIQTRAPEFRLPDDGVELERNFKETRWQGLAILGRGMEGPDRGWVEFVAFFHTPKGPGQLHEKSRFVRQDGLWFYADGDLLGPVTWGRNQPCYCGSGKKYKKCHGKS
ncbi:MAG: SEC-C domain-containing protein [Desulfobacterales bacterium]|nr:SEC-C domain-containing protein [Desulfobacterales bacterium]